MKIAALLFLAVITSTPGISFADQESEKGRLDECYLDLMDIAKDMNRANMNQSEDAPKINRKFDDKKSRCFTQKKDYEKKYGKYQLPKARK